MAAAIKTGGSWTPAEWARMREKLEKLSPDQLRLLATNVGIKFAGGNESVADRDGLSAKEQFILVLDEAGKEELLKEYKKIAH
jgi:hypothetical protein